MKGLIKRIGGFELSFTRRLHRGQKGFTLMELLIVVAILGVLAAVVIPRFTSLIGKGEAEAASTELEVVQTAMVAAMANAGESTLTDTESTGVQLGPTCGRPTDCPVDGFLQTSTGWEYTWDDTGTVDQGDKVS